jgi:NAD(P)-dependent dehydrogenase (short-subunit alcohol dehydrogenase family)
LADKGQVVVITGSTRGIGYGLADAFLDRGCRVGVCGRTESAVEHAVAALSKAHGPERVWGRCCDVTQYDQVRALWDEMMDRLGRIDIWINNAGRGTPPRDFWEHPAELVEAIVRTNLLGAMYGCQVALRGMLAQGFGQLYNMEGLGSDGGRVSGLTLYGTTKYGIRYLTDSLARETRGSPVLVGALSPGMVVTDFLIRPYDDRPEEWERAKRIFNILADRVETVTPWLAEKVLANTRTGVRFSWLTRIKVIGRFLTAPFRARDLFYDVPEPGSSSRSS